MEVLREQIPPASLDEVLVLFPDPWHKKRHHKRRLIQPPFIELLASRLQAGGVLRLATDWEEYALQMLEVLRAAARCSTTSRPPETGCRARRNVRPRVSKSAAHVSGMASGTWPSAGWPSSRPDRQDHGLHRGRRLRRC